MQVYILRSTKEIVSCVKCAAHLSPIRTAIPPSDRPFFPIQGHLSLVIDLKSST